MLTGQVTATTTATDLKTLMETEGVTFPTNGNDSCRGIILQINPAEATNSVQILSAGATGGPSLINDDTGQQPAVIAFRTDFMSRVYLKSSASTVAVNYLIEQI